MLFGEVAPALSRSVYLRADQLDEKRPIRESEPLDSLQVSFWEITTRVNGRNATDM